MSTRFAESTLRGLSFSGAALEIFALSDTRVKERRKSKRVPVTLPVQVIEDGATSPKEYESADLSEGGIFIKTDTPLPAFTPVRLTFPLSFSNHHIHASAIVVRSISTPTRPQQLAGMALQFIACEGEDLGLLQQFLDATVAGKDC